MPTDHAGGENPAAAEARAAAAKRKKKIHRASQDEQDEESDSLGGHNRTYRLNTADLQHALKMVIYDI